MDAFQITLWVVIVVLVWSCPSTAYLWRNGR